MEKLKRKWEEAKSDFDELPGGTTAVLAGFIIGFLIAVSCFFNIWIGICGMVVVAGLLVLNVSGVYMKPETCVVVAASMLGIFLTLVISLVILLVTIAIQSIILLII